jgi:hypothetical protein
MKQARRKNHQQKEHQLFKTPGAKQQTAQQGTDDSATIAANLQRQLEPQEEHEVLIRQELPQESLWELQREQVRALEEWCASQTLMLHNRVAELKRS